MRSWPKQSAWESLGSALTTAGKLGYEHEKLEARPTYVLSSLQVWGEEMGKASRV